MRTLLTEQDSFLPKRLVHFAPGESAEKPSQADEEAEDAEKPTSEPERQHQGVETTDFEPNIDECLGKLGSSREVKDFKQGLAESLEANGFENGSDALNKMWNKFATEDDKPGQKVEVRLIRDRIFKFVLVREDSEKEIELAPPARVIPIKFKVEKTKPTIIKDHPNYDANTGKVELNWQEAKNADIMEFFDRETLKEGTEITVQIPGQNLLHARFLKTNPKTDEPDESFYYTDEWTKDAKVKLYNGTKIRLVQTREHDFARKAQTERYSFDYPLGAMAKREKNQKFEDYIAVALGYSEDEDIIIQKYRYAEELENYGTYLLEKHNGNKANAIKEYGELLNKHNAIQDNGTMYLILDIDQLRAARLATLQERERKVDEKRDSFYKKAVQRERAGYLEKTTVSNARENPRFTLDPAITKLAKDQQKWLDAWDNPGEIQGLEDLKRVIQSEPILKQYDENKLAEKIRLAILKGKDRVIRFEDFIESILAGYQMPSYSSPAPKNGFPGPQPSFVDTYKIFEKSKNKVFEVALDFLQALGDDTVQSAQILQRDKNEIVMNIIYNQHAYTISINNKAKVKIETYPSNMKYPSRYGYKNTLNWRKKFLRNNPSTVRQEFENAVTPPMTYERFKKQHQELFNSDGSPKKDYPEHFTNQYSDAIIAGNRLLFSLRKLRHEKRYTDKAGETKFREKYKASYDNEHFIALVENEEKWADAWSESNSIDDYGDYDLDPKKAQAMERVAEFRKLVQTDAILQKLSKHISDKEMGERFREAIAKGKDHKLQMDEIFHIYSGLKIPGTDVTIGGKKGNYGTFRKTYETYFDKAGNPKDNMPASYAREFEQYIESMNRVMAVYEVGELNITEASRGEQNTQTFRNAILEQNSTEFEVYYNLEQFLDNINSNSALDIPQISADATYELEAPVGLQIENDALAGEGEALVSKHRAKVLQLLFQIYSIDELIDGGYIKKGSAPFESYVVTLTPAYFSKYLLAEYSPGVTNLEYMAQSGSTLSDHPEVIEILNPTANVRSYVDAIFPNEKSNARYLDAETGQIWKKSEKSDAKKIGRKKRQALSNVHNTFYEQMDSARAHKDLMAELSEDGEVNTKELLNKFNTYLDKAKHSLEKEFPSTHEDILKAYEKATGGLWSLSSVDDLEMLKANDNRSAAVREMIRFGFIVSHNENLQKEHELVKLTIAKNIDELKATLTEEDYEAMRNALRDSGMPEDDIPAAIEEFLPLYIAAGYDTDTGQLGLGAGVAYPIHTSYGTFYVGGGPAVGYNTKTKEAGVGAGIGAGYRTPNFGRISFTVGAGVGVGATVGGDRFTPGFSAAAFGALNYKVSRQTEASVGAGALVIPGAVLPIVGGGISYNPDENMKIEKAVNKFEEDLGFDKVDDAISLAKNKEEKKAAIIANPKMFTILSNKHGVDKNGGLSHVTADTVIKEYQEVKKNLKDEIARGWPPNFGKRLGSMSHRVGIGWMRGPDGRPKFTLLYGTNLGAGKKRGFVQYENKSREAIDQEINVLQLEQLLEQQKYGGTLTPNEKLRVEGLVTKIGESGVGFKRLDGPIGIMKKSPQEYAEIQQDFNAAIENVDDLGEQLNNRLAPLNLAVEYDQTMKLFELKILDHNTTTNYDIMADPAMKDGGFVFANERVYLASDFNSANPPTIRRADYEYPIAAEGAYTHTLISISDSPLVTPKEIYNTSANVISSDQGGTWREGKGGGKYEAPILASGKEYGIDQSDFDSINSQEFGKNSPEFEQMFDRLHTNETEFGTIENRQELDQFADIYLANFGRMYRIMSTQESMDQDYEKLTNHLKTIWKKTVKRELTTAELNYLRTYIAVESFSDLREKYKHSPQEVMQNAFLLRLEKTRDTLRKRFEWLVEVNHEKYDEGDSRRIKRTSAELLEYAMTTARNSETDPKKTETVHISQIDNFSTVVGSQNVWGMRGETYNKFSTDPNHMMLDPSSNFILALRDNPDSIEADMARLFLEENSRLNVIENLEKPDGKEVIEFLNAELTQKFVSTLRHPLTQKMFSSPDIRTRIVQLSLNKNAGGNFNNLTEKDLQALTELHDIVQGIRDAELGGQPYYYVKNNPDFRIALNVEARDGIYYACTNYSMWVNERLDLEYISSKIPQSFAMRAAYGESMAAVSSSAQSKFTKISVMAAVAAAPKKKPAATPPPEKTPEAGGEGETDQTTVETDDGLTGGHESGALDMTTDTPDIENPDVGAIEVGDANQVSAAETVKATPEPTAVREDTSVGEALGNDDNKDAAGLGF